MAVRYVYSGAAGAGTGADWANAHTTMAAAITAAAAGDTYYVADDHAETQASSLTLTLKGTAAAPDRIICVSRAGSVPPVAADLRTTGSISTTGATNLTIAGGVAYVYGIVFNCGNGSSASSSLIVNNGAEFQSFEACAFNLVNTSTSSRIIVPSGANSRVTWSNCTASFANASQSLSMSATGGRWDWVNGPGVAAVTGTLPTSLITSNGGTRLVVTWDGVDLSAFGSGKTLFPSHGAKVSITNCRLGGSVTVAGAPTARAGFGIRVVGSSSASNVSRNEIYLYEGTLTTEATIVRTAGASDGTTAYSYKIVTTANAKRDFPFETFEGAIWNTATGSPKTLTVHTVTDNVTLTDAEIWLEVEYLGSSGTPVATLITDANATVLTTAANQASDSGEAWTTTGLTTPLKQKLEVTFTPQMAGPIRWRVKVAKASTTVYVCPKADLS